MAELLRQESRLSVSINSAPAGPMPGTKPDSNSGELLRRALSILARIRRCPIFKRRHGNILFISSHKILDQLAADIIQGLPDDFICSKKVTVYIGIHRRFGASLFRTDFKIGVQTEQYFDQFGQGLWKTVQAANKTLKTVPRFDLVLELNRSNKPLYEKIEVPARQKIVFGPFIFPDKPIENQPGLEDRFLFFGTMGGARRRKIFESLDSCVAATLDDKAYGTELYDKIRKYRGVLNIHYDEGVYTEYPRLLTALLSGKIVLSEKLSDDLIAGEDYLLLDQAKIVIGNDKLIFDNFSKKLTKEYSFKKFIDKHVEGF
jgi:hypothetical protein